MEELQYNGYRFAYRRFGDRDAPAVMLIMGLGMPGSAWPDSLIAGLVREGFQVIIPDNRDCGRSSRFTEFEVDGTDVAKAVALTLMRRRVVSGYALEDMAFDLERILAALGIRRAHVVGISMGGMIAQVMAVQCPNRVATLTSIASASGNPSTGLGHVRAIWKLLKKPRAQTPDGLKAYFRDVFSVLSGKRFRPSSEELEVMLKKIETFDYDPAAMYRQLLAILASGDRSWQLARLQLPTLVIHGTDDPLLPLSAGEETAKLIPGARLVALEGMGHQLPEPLIPEIGSLIAAHCHAHPA